MLVRIQQGSHLTCDFPCGNFFSLKMQFLKQGQDCLGSPLLLEQALVACFPRNPSVVWKLQTTLAQNLSTASVTLRGALGIPQTGPFVFSPFSSQFGNQFVCLTDLSKKQLLF